MNPPLNSCINVGLSGRWAHDAHVCMVFQDLQSETWWRSRRPPHQLGTDTSVWACVCVWQRCLLKRSLWEGCAWKGRLLMYVWERGVKERRVESMICSQTKRAKTIGCWHHAVNFSASEGRCHQVPRITTSMSLNVKPATKNAALMSPSASLPPAAPNRTNSGPTQYHKSRACSKVVCDKDCAWQNCAWQSCVWEMYVREMCVKDCVWKLCITKSDMCVCVWQSCACVWQSCVCVTKLCVWEMYVIEMDVRGCVVCDKVVRDKDWHVCVCVAKLRVWVCVCVRVCNKVCAWQSCVCVWQSCMWEMYVREVCECVERLNRRKTSLAAHYIIFFQAGDHRGPGGVGDQRRHLLGTV